ILRLCGRIAVLTRPPHGAGAASETSVAAEFQAGHSADKKLSARLRDIGYDRTKPADNLTQPFEVDLIRGVRACVIVTIAQRRRIGGHQSRETLAPKRPVIGTPRA